MALKKRHAASGGSWREHKIKKSIRKEHATRGYGESPHGLLEKEVH
jgi:hypothetical protein